MRAFAISTLTFVLALGIAAGALAQTTTSPPPASAPSVQPPASSAPQVTTPGTSSSDSSRNDSVTTRTERRDGVAASPRTTPESTRIFGLNPTAAALIAAALLVVVILAIVSMSRGASRTDTHVDLNRRP